MAKVMITGASAGLGAEIAKGFARRGDELVLVARREALLGALSAELLEAGASAVRCIAADLADGAGLERVLAALTVDGGPDVLVNNAALGHWDASWDTPPEKLRTMIDLNVRALAELSTAFARVRHETSATLMNVASGAGYALFDAAIPYSATKFFVTSLTEGMDAELRRRGHPMRAKLLAPGPIATEFLARSVEGSSMAPVQLDASDVRFHSPGEVADFAMALFDSEFCVGAVQPDMSFVLRDGVHSSGSL